jgi:hypothetical protein
VVFRVTGYGPYNARVVLEAIISPTAFGAIVANGDLVLDGGVEITADDPNHPDPDLAVHTNSDLEQNGGSTDITGRVTATGDWDVADGDIVGHGSAARVDIPSVSAADYAVWADFILTDAGTMLNAATGLPICVWSAQTSCNGWDFDSATGEWSLGGTTPGAGTYYVEGDVRMTGSPGSDETPILLSIIAEGNIQISGSPKIAPDTAKLLFVTDKDLKITGSLDVVGNDLDVQGQMLVREQAEIGGNVSLSGQLLIQDAADASNLVTLNRIHGSVEITYSGGLGSSSFTVTGWRDVRDAD